MKSATKIGHNIGLGMGKTIDVIVYITVFLVMAVLIFAL